MRADIGVRAHEDAGVADEAAQPADRRRSLVGPLQAERPVVAAQHTRRRQVRQEPLPHPDRSGAGTAAAVGRAEGLVDVEVHDVEAGLARLEAAEDRVEVGAVHVGQRARLVDRVEQLADPASNSPSVEGLVIMTAAVRGPSAALKASRSTPPSAADGIVIVRKPAIEAVAGFVPCELSGTSTSSRSVSPRSRW